MNRRRTHKRVRATRDERGIALIVALWVTTVLFLLGVVFLSASAMESTIASNEVKAAQAFAIAEAGIEHARRELLTADLNAILTSNPSLITFTAGGPNVSFAGGTYSVRVDNNINPAFPRGVIPADPGGATNDTDRFLVITSTGTSQNVSRTIEVVVGRGGFEDAGAIYLPGTAAEVETKFGGDLFTISGNDTNLDGTAGTCPPLAGIATTDDSTTAAITDGDPATGGLAPFQFDNVTGAGSDPSVQNTNATYDVQAVINDLLTYPHTTLSNGIIGSATWGADNAPKLTYIDAPTVEINGNVTGSGVLVMPGTLKIKSGASFDFHGLVIVFDEISLQPGAPVNILGTLWLEPSAGLLPKLLELDPQGPATITYSCEAINMVNANWGAAFGGGDEAWPILSWRERN